MIALHNTLISDEIIEEHFVCDLHKCKGGCCVEGDCGAPLSKEETKIIKKTYPTIRHLLHQRMVDEIEEQGTHTQDPEYGYVTPVIDGGICVYGYYDENNIVKCSFEKAWKEGLISFQKPISCHLFPIRVKEKNGYALLNYEPQPTLCKPACKLGNTLKIPVYKFLKESITRKFGAAYYDELAQLAEDYKKFKETQSED